jgi:uncharacterized membrane protein HdeD (DUF308 family)
MKLTGVVFLIGGVLAILFPFLAGIAVELFLGAVLAIAGLAHFVGTWRLHGAKSRFWHLILALIYLAGGVMLLAAPAIGIAAFTLLIALTFILQGVTQLFLVLGGHVPFYRGWVTASGVLGLLVGILLIAQWPSSALWAVGFLAGVNLIFLGVALLTTRMDLVVGES